jgi:hypothetical protein
MSVYSNFSCRFTFLPKKLRPNLAFLRVSAMTDPGPTEEALFRRRQHWAAALLYTKLSYSIEYFRYFSIGRGGPPSSLTEETVKYFCCKIFRFSKILICSFRPLKPCMEFLRFFLIPFITEVRPQTRSADGKASIGGAGAIGGCRCHSFGSLPPCADLP